MLYRALLHLSGLEIVLVLIVLYVSLWLRSNISTGGQRACCIAWEVGVFEVRVRPVLFALLAVHNIYRDGRLVNCISLLPDATNWREHFDLQ